MALSDEEQRLLEQMEAALAAEDPKLVNASAGNRHATGPSAPRGPGRCRVLRGLGLLIAGMSINPFLSVLGFVIMVAAAVTAIYSWQHVGRAAPTPARGRDRAKTPQGSRPDEGQGFMDKMEERWRRRRDEGF